MNSFLDIIREKIDGMKLRFYYFFRVKLSLSPKKRRILFIKNDSIGDYIIFRNFIEETGKSERFKGYEIYLMCTKKVESIARELDGAILKDILIYNPSNFRHLDQQIKIFNTLNSYQFEYVLHPTFSPDTSTQYLIKYIAARYKIGFEGDVSNQSQQDKKLFEEYYSRLISVPHTIAHEYQKNEIFFTELLGKKSSLGKPKLKERDQSKVNRRILVCPGAQEQYRIWSREKFAQLIDLIQSKFPGFVFVVVTGPGEESHFTEITRHCTVKTSNFQIRSVSDFVLLMSESHLAICNDSSAVHIAVACSTPNVCISNGNNFRRFIPYPEEMKIEQKVVLPDGFLKELAEKDNQIQYYFGSKININEISVDSVFKACTSFLETI